jgi:hypothetical protein
MGSSDLLALVNTIASGGVIAEPGTRVINR